MSETKQDYINYRVQKAKEVFEDAKFLAEGKRWNSCVNRLYYSSFHLVNALLYKNDINAQTHNGVKTQFNNHFIKTQILTTELGQLYSLLFDWRQESDYSDFVDFDEHTVLSLIDKVLFFNQAIEKLIIN